jgi:hypothetical protein
MHLLIRWTYDGIGERTDEETNVGITNGVEDINEFVSDDPDWDVPDPITVGVGKTGAKVIVSERELDIVIDGDGRGRTVERVVSVTVEWCGGKDVALVDVDELKPRQVRIGEADDGKVADVINVSVGVIDVKGVWGIQVENREGAGVVEPEVDTSCAEFGAEIASWVDEIDEVILTEGVAEEHNVPSADDTPKERKESVVYPMTTREINQPFDEIDNLSTPTDVTVLPEPCSVLYKQGLKQVNWLGDTNLSHLVTLDPVTVVKLDVR